MLEKASDAISIHYLAFKIPNLIIDDEKRILCLNKQEEIVKY
jgi:hypothetical protein